MEHLNHPPTISMMPKWRIFASLLLHHCYVGKGIIVPFYSVQNYNIGQNKWNIWTTPPSTSDDVKMARFCYPPSSLLWQGGG